MKQCPRCLQLKLTSDFSPNPRRRDQLSVYCKPCMGDYARERSVLSITPKRCARCQTTKSAAEFSRNRRARDGLGAYCKPCAADAQREKRASDPDLFREYARVWAAKRRGDPKRHAAYIARRSAARARERARPDWDTTYLRTRCKQYGITPADYQRMLVEQGHRCAICRQPETFVLRGKVKNLSIDHDHATGRVRGLLCGSCNSGIGYFREHPDILRAAIDYLSASEGIAA